MQNAKAEGRQAAKAASPSRKVKPSTSSAAASEMYVGNSKASESGVTKGSLQLLFGQDVQFYNDKFGRPFAFLEHRGEVSETMQDLASKHGIPVVRRLEAVVPHQIG